MSRRFPLTRIAVLLSLSLSPIATPYALAQISPEYLQDGYADPLVFGNIENTASSNYPYIRLQSGAVRNGDLINSARLQGGYYDGSFSVEASTLNGNIRNEANSTAYGVGLAQGKVSGDIVNNGDLYGRYIIFGFAGVSPMAQPSSSSVTITSHSTVGGKIINNGTIYSDSNSVVFPTSGLAIEISNSSAVNGGIENNGTINGGILVTDGSAVNSDIVNIGTINANNIASSSMPVNNLALELRNASTVTGNIDNKGTLNGGILIGDNSHVKGDIVNAGVIYASSPSPIFPSSNLAVEVRNGSTVDGRIENSQTINGGIMVSGGAEVTGGIVNSGSILANTYMFASSSVAVDVEGAGQPMVITNTGTIIGDVRLGASTLNIDGGNIYGAITGEDNQHSFLFASGGGTSTVNINTNYAPQGNITVGAVNVAAGKTLTLSGTKVNGLLTVNGTLAGSGDVGNTTLASGATLSPGTAAKTGHVMMSAMTLAPIGSIGIIPTNSEIGTVTVNGDLTFMPGSTYRVDATDDGKSDRVNVTGTANLAGNVVHIGSGGTYAASTAYTILSANSVNGKFGGVSSDLAYLQPTLNQEGNDVVLKLDMKEVPVDPDPKPTNPDPKPAEPDTKPSPGKPVDNGGGNTDSGTRPIEFADLAVTGNQRSAANAVQTLPKTSSLYTRVLNLPNGAPADVFADLSGESFGSSVSAMQNVSNNVASLPTAQLRANMNAGFIPGPPTAQVGRGDASMLPRSNAQPLWAQAFGNWRSMDGNGNVAKSRERDVGIFVGGDHGVGNGWRLGGAFGYTDSRITVDDRSAKSDVNSYSAILYGGKSFEAGSGKINFTAGLAYTWHDIDSKRNINAAGQYQELKADYSASTGQVFTDVGYAIPLNDRVTLEPFFGADFSDLRTRGFSESGGDAALSGRSSTNNVGTTTLGLRAQTTFDVKDTAGRLRGMLGWRHAYGDVNPEATMSFDGSQPFTVAGNPLARDAAVMEVGVDLAMSKNATLGLAYSGQFGDGNRQNTGTVNVSWRF